MSQSSINNTQKNNILYASGRITTTINYSIPATSNISVANIDISGLDVQKINVFVFGQVNDDFAGIIPPTHNYVIQPGIDAAFFFYTAPGAGVRLDLGYRLSSGNLSIDVVNTLGGSFIPIAPFLTGTIDYFIFYY